MAKWSRTPKCCAPAPASERSRRMSDSAPLIHPSAVIDPSAKLADGVSVGAFSLIGADVEIGAGTSEIRRMLIGREIFQETL